MSPEAETVPRESPLAAEHERLRASWVRLAGHRLPGHYGDDDAAGADEYRAATEACSIVDLPERGIIEVGGPKRIDFLQRILSNEIAALAPGAGQLAALMNTKGQLLALMRVLVEAKRVAIELDRGSLDRLVDSFEHFRVAAPVRFGRPEVSAVALLGPGAPALLGGLGLPVPQEANDHDSGSVDGVDVRVVRASDLPERSSSTPEAIRRSRCGAASSLPERAPRADGLSTPCASSRGGPSTVSTSASRTCCTRRDSSVSTTPPRKGATSARR